ncbi:MAG: MazG nucleotide pyrophosphohydrolase domain-containing protein [Armatimonadota bacterium]|nr:MazG nucleotide pyrophosphohydrolase domain-containing protein [Armatimonadota bacterium]MDR7450463.1 MazG nucleotide pyrophosphohydrolase domain-containing protein [Armatimonadota bacterium]MDR7466954.1 MazG nucleotide pyrophosphohydrolase domain-containing protein [Armatimonadota bacterium]MDR7493504.1 MazG nucleotide pyrophosphohydrolase domain-containing protein [Armatimonadota bacterium]MDR7498769.1 MazG nucleotide pyrophosphohydrolase domain-containing protein [Armatimonadota bacterium
MHLREFQEIIRATYGARDRARGADATFRWLAEEIGELAQALRKGDPQALREEFSDVLAWTVSLAGLCGVDAEDAVSRYAAGCPKCGHIPCDCPGEQRG